MTVMPKRSGARASNSSTVRIPALPLPTTRSRWRPEQWLFMAASDARGGEARRPQRKKARAQVVPPCECDAGHVEHQEDFQRQIGTPGSGDRGAETARDQIAAAGANGADEPQRGGAFESGRFQGQRSVNL